MPCAKRYFFSSGFDSLGEVGDGVVVVLDEAAPPAGAVLLAPVPVVLLELLDASAPGAGDGVGEVVVVVVLLLVLGDEAGGVVTVFSSFLLQASRPTARAAAIRSERFMFFPLENITRVNSENGRRSGSIPRRP